MVSMHVHVGHAGPESAGLAAVTISTLRSAPWRRRPGSCSPAGAAAGWASTRRRWSLDGETLAVRAARRLAAVCAPVVEVGDGVSGLPRPRSAARGAGPLAALAAAGAWLRERGLTRPRARCWPSTSRRSTNRCSAWLRDRPGRADGGAPRRRAAPAGVRALRRRCPARRRQPGRRRDPGPARALRRRRPRRGRGGRMVRGGRAPTRSSTSTPRPTPSGSGSTSRG